MRYSKQRDAIMEVLRSTKEHPDAEWIYNKVKQHIENISLGTVYRNLKELSQNGDILTFNTEGNVMHFDADISAHAHFVCRNCGKITDIYSNSGLKTALEENGYAVDGEELIFYGFCPNCAAQTDKTVKTQ